MSSSLDIHGSDFRYWISDRKCLW